MQNLRALPQWQNFAEFVSTDRQGVFCNWLYAFAQAIDNDFDPRPRVTTDTAAALSIAAIRSLNDVKSLGLRDDLSAKIDDIIHEIESGDRAFIGWGINPVLGLDCFVGRRGSATTKKGAITGFTVRMLSTWVPIDVESRAATIAAFARFAGVECSSQNARSILLQGRT